MSMTMASQERQMTKRKIKAIIFTGRLHILYKIIAYTFRLYSTLMDDIIDTL